MLEWGDSLQCPRQLTNSSSRMFKFLETLKHGAVQLVTLAQGALKPPAAWPGASIVSADPDQAILHLHLQAALGNTAGVLRLLQMKVDPNGKCPGPRESQRSGQKPIRSFQQRFRGYTPIQTAAENGSLNVVKQLIAAGADLIAVDECACCVTPLMAAIDGGHDSVALELIAAGADVNAKNECRETALRYAAHTGNSVVVQKLLAAGADVDAGGTWSPICVAADEGHIDVVQQLLAAGANVNSTRDDETPPLHSMAGQGQAEMVQRLLKAGAEVDAFARDGTTALFSALSKGYTGIADQLLAAGADPNVAAAENHTLLHIAADRGLADTVLKLIEAGADVHAKTVHGMTPLDYAVDCGSRTTEHSMRILTVQHLLAAGADVRTADNRNITPLHRAAASGLLEACSILLAAGADVMAAMSPSTSVLNYAAYSGNKDMVQLVLHAMHGDVPHDVLLKAATSAADEFQFRGGDVAAVVLLVLEAGKLCGPAAVQELVENIRSLAPTAVAAVAAAAMRSYREATAADTILKFERTVQDGERGLVKQEARVQQMSIKTVSVVRQLQAVGSSCDPSGSSTCYQCSWRPAEAAGTCVQAVVVGNKKRKVAG